MTPHANPSSEGAAAAVLRLARRSDIDAIQRVRHSVRENRLTSGIITDAEVADAIERTGRGWVVETGGTIVGFSVGNARTGNIWALFVDPAHEGRGHGRRLHDTLVEWLWSIGQERLWLTTMPGTRAERFYASAGWRNCGPVESGELRFELGRPAACAPWRLLRPATPADRQRVYEWLARSDATASMLGPPHFPDAPVPTWEEFCSDYIESFFLPEGAGCGRLYVIHADGRDIGCASYSELDRWQGFAELDIWIGEASDWGRGWGSGALRELGNALLAHPSVEGLLIRPSKRNARALASYRRAGFVEYDAQSHRLPEWALTEGLDYADAVVMVRLRGAGGG